MSEEWHKEFYYLLNNKILSRDELGYLLNQIKSVVDQACKVRQEEIERLKEENKDLKDVNLDKFVSGFIKEIHSYIDRERKKICKALDKKEAK